jgi:hypothetical protein
VWIREPGGWVIFFRAEKLETKPFVYDLINHHRGIIGECNSWVVNNHRGIDYLAFLAEGGFPLTEDYIKKAISSEPQQEDNNGNVRSTKYINCSADENTK